MSHSSCWIMCGGPSHSFKVDTPDGDTVIAVNRDVFRYGDADYFITMDNRFSIWELENKNLPKKPIKIFIANMADENIRCDKTIVDRRWGISYSLAPYDMIVKSYKKEGFGLRWNDFRNGSNSGFCAIQLAIILGFKVIHLVGMDLGAINNQTHHHGGYEKCKDDYPKRFDEFFLTLRDALQTLTGVMLVNHSKHSRLTELIGYDPLP